MPILPYPPPEIRLAIFDLDGVLFDSSSLVAPAMWDALARLEAQTPGLTLPRPTEGQVYRMLGLPNSRYVQALGYDLSPDQWADLKEFVEDREVELIAAGMGRLYPGFDAVLTALRAGGVRCVVASNCGRRYLRAISDRFGLGQWIEDARCNDDFPSGGKADLLKMLLAATRMPPGQAMYFGDRAFDADAARCAGTHFLACRWGFGDNDHFSPDVTQIRSPGQILVALGMAKGDSLGEHEVGLVHPIGRRLD